MRFKDTQNESVSAVQITTEKANDPKIDVKRFSLTAPSLLLRSASARCAFSPSSL